jgi:pimeloyl-ACP methyl ester carboxylesterase
MARALAALGFLTVRVDLSGLGDSESRRDSTPFEQASVLETRAIMSALEQEFGVSHFVTAGLCSGAVVAFRTAVDDDRVRGAVLINPQGFVSSVEWNAHVVSKARARRYWSEKLLSPASWRRALTGRSHYGSLADVIKRRALSLFARNEAVADVAGGLAAEFGGLQTRGARLLLACSEGDLGMDYLQSILGPRFTRRERMDTLLLPKGDHSLTMAVSQRRFLEGLERWARAFVPQPAAAAAGMPAAVAVARAPLP